MRKIEYYVAMSLDSFICGPDEDVSGFLQEGNGIQKYLNDLQEYDTVIMGRKTYEFGYKYGMKPGDLAYQHMKHYIFSETLKFENQNEQIEIYPMDISKIDELKQGEGSNIYMCGGGALANWLLEHEKINLLKIKLNPFIQGEGTRLFGNSTKNHQLKLLEREEFEHGLLILTYEIKY